MKILQIGVLGYGNVGKGVVDYFLNANNENSERYKLAAVGTKKDGPRNITISPGLGKADLPIFTTNPLEDIVRNPEIDIIVDAVGGSAKYDASSLQHIEESLKNKKHVVTANKQNVARNLANLTQLANANEVNLRFEAAVCGGIPIIKQMRQYFAHDQITKIVGIINGTSNYILTQMSRGMSREEATKQAQDKGYAEADPTSDLNGKDAAAKLAILASLAFRTHITTDMISTEGIDKITSADIFYMERLADYTGKYHSLKQVAVAKRTENGLELSVHPAYISEDHPLFGTNEAINAITIVGQHGGTYTFKGPGAGSKPTAFAVISDIMEIGSQIEEGTYDNFSSFSKKIEILKNGKSKGYIRSNSPEHEIGAFARKLTVLAEHELDVSQVYNFPPRMAVGEEKLTPDIISIEEANEKKIKAALKVLFEKKYTQGDVVYVREEATTF